MAYNAQPTGESPAEILQSILPLVPSSPSLIPLLRSRLPFQHPSLLPRSDLHKLLTKVNSHVLSKEQSQRAMQERKDSWVVAKCLLEMDEEGYVVGGWGKSWVTGLMPLVSSASLPSSSLPALLSLLTTLFTLSPSYPSFSRETALPAIPKYSQALVGILSRAEEKGSWDAIATVLPYLPTTLRLSPTPHRPLIPILLPILHRLLILAPSPKQASSKTPTIRTLTSTLLSTLHILLGKVSASAAWKTDFLGAIQEMHVAMNGITGGGWVERGDFKVEGNGGGSVTAMLEMLDPGLADEERVDRLVNCLDGWLEVLLALMRYPTARPVAFPIGSIVTLALRMFSLNYETPIIQHVTIEHKAKLVAVLPRLWVVAAKLVGRLSMAVGDHLLPSLGVILEHTIYLQEILPKTALSSRLSLLRFHKLLLTRLHPDPSSAAFPTRLLKDSLTSISSVLAPRPVADPSAEEQAFSVAANGNGNGMGKKGKKRMRNAGEDALVAGMDGGRAVRTFSALEGEIVVAALNLVPCLLAHPALPEHLLSFAVKVHLSLSLALPSRSASSISEQDLGLRNKLITGVAKVLECAMALSGGHGSRRPWTSLVVALPELRDSAQLPLLLHPEMPPLVRPLPPVSSLSFYRPETEDEKALRRELGISVESDPLPTVEKEVVESTQDGVEVPRGTKRQATEAAVTWGPPPPVSKLATVTAGSSIFGQSAPVVPVAQVPAPAMPNASASTSLLQASDAAVVEPSATQHVDDTPQPLEPTSIGIAASHFISHATAASVPIEVGTSQAVAQTPTVPEVDMERKEGVRYDSEGEEIPELNMDSDTDDEEEEEEDDE